MTYHSLILLSVPQISHREWLTSMPFVLILSRDVVCTLLSCSAVDVVLLFFVAGHRIGLLTVPHACGGSRNVLNFFFNTHSFRVGIIFRIMFTRGSWFRTPDDQEGTQPTRAGVVLARSSCQEIDQTAVPSPRRSHARPIHHSNS